MRFDMAALERASPTEAINLRASVEQKALIDRAARRLGKSRTEFVLDTMREAVENVLPDQRLFGLDEATFSAFEAMLDAPIEAGGALRRTLSASAPWDRRARRHAASGAGADQSRA